MSAAVEGSSAETPPKPPKSCGLISTPGWLVYLCKADRVRGREASRADCRYDEQYMVGSHLLES